MDSSSSEILVDAGSFRLYKDGHADRTGDMETVPAGFDADTGVTSKDVVIDAVTGVFVRLYLPPIEAASDDDVKKLPILVFFHGGYFVVRSASCPKHHRYINDIVAKSSLIAISVDYRLAPEHLLPAAYDDSWAALNWALSGADPWLSEHGDTSRVFLAGCSAGGNIAHNITIAVGVRGLDAAVQACIEGTLLLHPSFCGETRMEGEPEQFWDSVKKRWSIIFPDAEGGLDDPRMNPVAAGAPSLTKLACERLLVCAAAEDPRRPRERAYYDAVKSSGWGGEVDWFESEGEGHGFFVHEYGSSEAVKLMDRFSFARSGTMDSSSAEILIDLGGFRLYKDGHADRSVNIESVPAGFDDETGVTSKDVVIDAVTGVSARLYLPPIEAATDDDGKKKLPILVFFHGGYFVAGSASYPPLHRYTNYVVASACVVAVSVNYRLAPEHLLPAAYEDSWLAISWAVSGTADPWLSEHGDTGRVFLTGASAGGNIAHNMTIAVGVRGLDAVVPAPRIEGTILLHPSFCGQTRMEGEPAEFRDGVKKRWAVIFPDAKDGLDDPRMNPMAAGAPSLTKLACERMLVCAAALDPRRTRERAYYDAVKASGWEREVEWFESEGEGHHFFVDKHGSHEAIKLMERLAAFIAGN
uniref:Alpha/beta hydrolase fold-3 domain-containing protein n=1 Tax=Oryza punctata TaxID=4537 RepID=A0A0E0M200_ORYPU